MQSPGNLLMYQRYK